MMLLCNLNAVKEKSDTKERRTSREYDSISFCERVDLYCSNTAKTYVLVGQGLVSGIAEDDGG